MKEVLTPPCRGKVGISVRNRPKVPAEPGVKYSFNGLTKVGQTNGEISGEQLFLRYAFPCVDAHQCVDMEEWRGIIKPNDAIKLMTFVDENKNPTHLFLAKCFPTAVHLFGESAGINPSLDDPWSVEKVREFWRMHKGRNPRCVVMCGKVMTIQSTCTAKMTCAIVKLVGGITIPALNRYNLPVLRGKRVWVHKHIIAEAE